MFAKRRRGNDIFYFGEPRKTTGHFCISILCFMGLEKHSKQNLKFYVIYL